MIGAEIADYDQDGVSNLGEYALNGNPDARFEGATAVFNPADVPDDAIVCGGAAIYDLLIPQCDQLLVTTVKKEVEGDTFFNSHSDVKFSCGGMKEVCWSVKAVNRLGKRLGMKIF